MPVSRQDLRLAGAAIVADPGLSRRAVMQARPRRATGSAPAPHRVAGRPIRLTAAFPPGGGPDLPVRSLAPGPWGRPGQPNLLENRAGGDVGAEVAMRGGEPGGMGPGTLAPSIQKKRERRAAAVRTTGAGLDRP